jgi:hypothetical protein
MGVLPTEFVVGIPLSRAVGSNVPFTVLGLAAMGCFVVGGWRVLEWRCPQCGEQFHHRNGWTNTLTRKCLHCGLPKRAPA